MEMTELPLKEKVTLEQRRKVQKQEKQATSSNAWILTTCLPARYRIPEIVSPPRAPTEEHESNYVGLYTFVVSLIYLSNGTVTEGKLENFLKKMNADNSTPVAKTDVLLQKMIKEGYVVKHKDSSAGEEQVLYTVGSRGKAEIGEDGVAGLARTVYGNAGREDLEKRLARSLGLTDRSSFTQAPQQNGVGRGRGRPKQHADTGAEQEAGDDENDDEED